MNINTLVISLLSSCICLVSLQANAKNVPFPQCPSELPVTQHTREYAKDGWKTVNNTSTRQLEHIGISAGEYPTVQTGLDIPTDEKKPNGDIIAHYDVTPYTSGTHDYWVVCEYRNSAVLLVQQIPQNVRRCEVKYRNDILASDRVTIQCFDK
jgi:hypothetical protein